MVGGEHLSEIDFEEQDLLDREALTEPFYRLSCQAKIFGDVMVQVPEEKWGGTEDDTKVSQ
jgi:2Fe-2S ferredoxin